MDWSFWRCSTIGPKDPFPEIWDQTWQLYLSLKRFRKYINHLAHLLSSADINIFSQNISNIFHIKKYRYILFRVLKGCSGKHGCNFDYVIKIGYSKSSFYFKTKVITSKIVPMTSPARKTSFLRGNLCSS